MKTNFVKTCFIIILKTNCILLDLISNPELGIFYVRNNKVHLDKHHMEGLRYCIDEVK